MTLDLAAGAHPLSTGLLFAAGALYAAGFAATAARSAFPGPGPDAAGPGREDARCRARGAWRWSGLRPLGGRPVVALGALAHLAATVGRGLAIEFLPLTSKVESFSAFSLCTVLVLLAAWRDARAYLLPVLGLAVAALAAALLFPLDLVVPPPLMRTVWYPLHVPLSFFAYGAWLAAGGGAIAWLCDRDPAWLRRIDRLALIGFGLWSLSMICGGFWGVAAWGAYFLWDPKVVWSVILWFHFASFVHVRLTPSLRDVAWVRPAMALVGVAWIFVAYVGTSFLFGDSSHAF